jgi:uncharacterized protein (TIGR02453 family)
MALISEFTGFPKETVKFFRDLEKNNEKQWFEENKKVYQKQVLEPAQAFVATLGKRLATISPKVVADPRINQSIFRIYRDTRFSKDKSPYKTHLGILLWEGPGKKMENSGYYIQVDAAGIFLGAGLYMFPANIMEAYREAVVDPQYGPALIKAVETVTQNSAYHLGGEKYKRVPRGYDPGHPLAGWLLYKGLYHYFESGHPAELHSAAFADFCFGKFKDMSPLHHWMRELTERVI